jgi:hypothetical protein
VPNIHGLTSVLPVLSGIASGGFPTIWFDGYHAGIIDLIQHPEFAARNFS